jgi:hypothetical protein
MPPQPRAKWLAGAELEPVTVLLTASGQAEKRTQYSSAAGNQGLDSGRHVGTPAREPGGTSQWM